jgi:hypothetical protein
MNYVLHTIHATFAEMYCEMSLDECQTVFEQFVRTPMADLKAFHAYQRIVFNEHRREKLQHELFDMGCNQEEGMRINDALQEVERQHMSLVQELQAAQAAPLGFVKNKK